LIVRTLRFFLPLIRRYLWHYCGGVLVIPLSTFCVLAMGYVLGKAVGLLESNPENLDLLYEMGMWIVLLSLGRGVFLFMTRFWITGASRRIEYDLRNQLFSHLQSLDRNFYDSVRTGDLMSRSTADVEAVRAVVGPAVMYSINTLFMLGMALPLMISISGWLTFWTMVPLVTLPLAVRLIGPRVQVAFRKAQETLSEISAFAQESAGGVRVVKSFAFEDRQIADFDALSDKYFDRNLSMERISNWMHPTVGAIQHVTTIIVFVVGGQLILQTKILGLSPAEGFSLHEFIAFSYYLGLLTWPMISIGWVVNQIYRGLASVKRLEEILTRESKVLTSGAGFSDDERATPAASSTEPRGEVEVRNLTFSYGANRVLEDVSLRIRPGETVALIGRTGCGKSTLAGLIPRQFAVPDGTIFVDGVDVNKTPLNELRRAVGFVPQETFLFSRTLAQNIAFGVSGDEGKNWLDEVENYAKISRLDKDIDQFAHGYDEIVGERGVTLSGGQRQRVAISRALLYKPSILILDDALSAVDTHTEEEILARLREATDNLSVLVISHRISSIKDADRIYVLDGGRIVEEGVHEDLRGKRGVYEELYQLQLLEQELEEM
jgi:ATP-binding cassette subfamily B multidrug efflux pump